MKRLPRSLNKIACIECEWFGRQDPTSVEPLLQTLQACRGAVYYYGRCYTQSEFEYHLTTLGRSPSYNLIYMAMHGAPGRVEATGFDLSLEQLAPLLGSKYQGRIIHFGTCSTLRCERSRIEQFIADTGVAMVTGFTRNIDWLESAAFDLLYLGLWQGRTNIGAYEKRLYSLYGEMAQRLGFVVHKADAG